MCHIIESKLSEHNIQNITKLPNFKIRAHPMQRINVKKTSNGMLTMINKNCTSESDIKHFYKKIENKYIMKHISTKYKLAIISAYVPPIINNKKKKYNTLRLEKMDSIYRDLFILIQIAKKMDYKNSFICGF